jgi:septal ring factor EnvC (AmiA/AmiB activator)
LPTHTATTEKNYTANRAFAFFSNTIGGGNTTNDFAALSSNTTGENNTASKVHRPIAEQDKRVEELTARLKEQAAQIQKVTCSLN